MSILALPALRYVPSRSTRQVAQVTMHDVHLFEPDFMRVERDKLRVLATSCDAPGNPFTRWADEIDASLRAIGFEAETDPRNLERQMAGSVEGVA